MLILLIWKKKYLPLSDYSHTPYKNKITNGNEVDCCREDWGLGFFLLVRPKDFNDNSKGYYNVDLYTYKEDISKGGGHNHENGSLCMVSWLASTANLIVSSCVVGAEKSKNCSLTSGC